MAQEHKKTSWRLVDFSLPLALAATGIYYAVMFSPACRGSLLFHYSTEHPVDYVIVAMFIWGMLDLFLLVCSFPRELWALRQKWIPARTRRVPVTEATELLRQVEAYPPALLASRIGQRLTAGLSFVVENKSAEDLDDQLRYLGDQAAEAEYNRYALSRFVIATTPILGFLGTVVHFGTAFNGLSLGNLENELSHVVSEMGTAFNTTTVALGSAMFVMFAKFLCEKLDGSITHRVSHFTERELSNRFEVKDANLVPFLSTLENANREFLGSVETLLQQQVAGWSNALETLFQQFENVRQNDARHWDGVHARLVEREKSLEGAQADHMGEILSLADARQEQNLARIQHALSQATQFSGDLSSLANVLKSIAQGEGRLVDLQSTLSDNLKALHETGQIDAALHGLTAAIHLLTVRNQTGVYNNAA